MPEKKPAQPKESRVTLKMPSDDLSRSVVGFVAALIAGALIPRTFGYLVRRVFFRAFKEVFVLAVAGWLADLVATSITSSSNEKNAS